MRKLGLRFRCDIGVIPYARRPAGIFRRKPSKCTPRNPVFWLRLLRLSTIPDFRGATDLRRLARQRIYGLKTMAEARRLEDLVNYFRQIAGETSDASYNALMLRTACELEDASRKRTANTARPANSNRTA